MSTAVEQEQRVTPLELFFDLVFVFAITQVTALMLDDPTAAGYAKGALVLGTIYWAWSAFTMISRSASGKCAVRRPV